jgi:hypothetical protein
MPLLRHLSLSIALLILLPTTAQTKKERIAALQVTVDSLRSELVKSRLRAQEDERARNALRNRLDTLQQGRARDAANHLKREQRLQQDLDLANNTLQQARDELAALQQEQATAMTRDPYSWYVPLKKEIVDAVPVEEAANNVLGVMDHLINNHCMSLKSMDEEGEVGWAEEEDIVISLTHHSQQFLFLWVHRDGFSYGGSHYRSSDMIAFRKASGEVISPEALLLPERKAQLAAALQKKVRALNAEVNACGRYGDEDDAYDLTDWSPSEWELSAFTIYKDGVSFNFNLLHNAHYACEPGIVFEKREVAPFFVRGVWDQ